MKNNALLALALAVVPALASAEITVTGGVWATSLSGATAGYVRVDATASRLSVTGVGVTGPLSDSATITR